jgi:hypothetical protein
MTSTSQIFRLLPYQQLPTLPPLQTQFFLMIADTPDWDYGPTPFEGPATDDELGLTDAPISIITMTLLIPIIRLTSWTPRLMMTLALTPMMILIFLVLDPYAPNLMDAQTNDDLGFEDSA